MNEFIAKMGYMLIWGLGEPKYSFDEAFVQYYTIGLTLIVVGIVCVAVLPILIVLYKRMESKEK